MAVSELLLVILNSHPLIFSLGWYVFFYCMCILVSLIVNKIVYCFLKPLVKHFEMLLCVKYALKINNEHHLITHGLCVCAVIDCYCFSLSTHTYSWTVHCVLGDIPHPLGPAASVPGLRTKVPSLAWFAAVRTWRNLSL